MTPLAPPRTPRILAFGPGVGVGPLTALALAVDCTDASCPTGGDSASFASTLVQFVDPNDAPAVDAAVTGTNVTDGYYNPSSHIALNYAAYDPGGVCSLTVRLVTASGAPAAATTQGTVTPTQDPNNNSFQSTLPCGSANTSQGNATQYTFSPDLTDLPDDTYFFKIFASNPGQVYQSDGASLIWQSSPIQVDNSVPEVSLSTSAQPGTWYGSSQQLTISASDDSNSAGIGDVICTGPCAPGADLPIPASALPFTVTVPGSGAQTVTCQATSNSGISSPTVSSTLDIDTQTPTTTFGGAAPFPAVLSVPEAVTVAASEPQTASGISSTTCTVTTANGPPQSYTIAGAAGQLNAADFSDGMNVISCQSTTNASIAGLSASETIDIDDQ